VRLWTWRLDVVIVEAKIELTKNAVVDRLVGIVDKYPAVPRPLTVEANWVSRKVVETNPRRLGMEIKGRMEEASSAGSMKLLMYRSRPAVVEMRLGEEIKLRRF
jgi:hypothetical protein